MRGSSEILRRRSISGRTVRKLGELSLRGPLMVFVRFMVTCDGGPVPVGMTESSITLPFNLDVTFGGPDKAFRGSFTV